MTKEDILLLRNFRRKTINVCNCIYKRKWDIVCEEWNNLELEFYDVLTKNIACNDNLKECRSCVKKGNYLRLLDLLLYGIDPLVVQCLCNVGTEDRLILAREAEMANKKVLQTLYHDIFKLIENENSNSRIECRYEGTENVELSIIDNKYKFRLFSKINPWLESQELVNGMGKRKFEEIYVLGFGGGYLIEQLTKKFSDSKIKVYLPNIDIFKTVICNIPVSNILQNKNLDICTDTMCLNFFLGFENKTDKNIGYYVDRQELRACVKDINVFKKLMESYKKKQKKCDIIKEKVGVKIEKCISGLTCNSL